MNVPNWMRTLKISSKIVLGTGASIQDSSGNSLLTGTGLGAAATTLTGTTITGTTKVTSAQLQATGVTGVALTINKTANTGGTLKVHCHQMAASTDDSPTQYANEFKGEFLATSGTMDGIASHFNMDASGTGVLRAVIGVAYLNAGKTLSGTAATGSWISGGLFSAALASTAVLNGTAVVVNAVCGKVTSAIDTTMTACNHVAAIHGISSLLTKPVSGECSILYLSQEAGATTINQAIYIGGGATVDAFVKFDVAASGKAIQTSAVDIGGGSHVTSHAIHIKIGSVDGYIPVWDAANFA